MSQVEVDIMGQRYRLACPDGDQERLQEAARRVDEAMCKIRESGKVLARDRIAVLVALNLAFDLSDPNSKSPPESQVCTLASPAVCAAKAAALMGRMDAVLVKQTVVGDTFSCPPVVAARSALAS